MTPHAPRGHRSTQITLENAPATEVTAGGLDAPDSRDGRIYVHDDDTKLAVEVALTTGRPLLLRGDPGSGKSSLAPFVARNLGWRYLEHVVTAATRAEDLLWSYDAVRRLSDAQVRVAGDPPLVAAEYVEPGVLWWALDPGSARRRGADDALEVSAPHEPNGQLNVDRNSQRAVMLIDELDKADPDVPNGLLTPLGSQRFVVKETGAEILLPRRDVDQASNALGRLLVVITTNDERDLPHAFLRRCIVHRLDHPGPARLVEIARLHFERPAVPFDAAFEFLCTALAERLSELRVAADELRIRPPSTAEYLDALRACRALGISTVSAEWAAIERVTLAKDERLAQATQ